MATTSEVRWLHYSPDDRLGRYIPSSGREKHRQYLPRAAPDPMSPGEHGGNPKVSILEAAETRRKMVESIQMSRERPRVAMVSEEDESHIDPSTMNKYYQARSSMGGMAGGDGYFGETYVHSLASKQTPSLFTVRNMVMDGVHTNDGRFRSIRDLVSQLWFDDLDEATAGASGLCDLTVPTHSSAVPNRELIGASPTTFEGLERLIQSGHLNAAYQACEALGQLAFRNSRNGTRIMTCMNPNLKKSLCTLLDQLETDAMDDDSKFDLRSAVLRVFNNCAWNSRQSSIEIAEDAGLLDHVEHILVNGSKVHMEDPVPVPLLLAMDACVGLLNHLSTEPHSREILVRRKTAEKVLLPVIIEAEEQVSPPEQYLCTVAGAVEVVIKLMWDTEKPPFTPPPAVLQTIIWTLVCSLDGVMWAGITWSSLGRVQALSKLSAVDDLKVQLIDMDLVEVLARLINQWTPEQGVVVLEGALLTLLNLLTHEEGRWRMYRIGVHRPFRCIITGQEGVTDLARERAVLCAWLLFEWQVRKSPLACSRAKT